MFLTLEDERAQIKGSRDPLGTQFIWTAVGRQVVANLTTVTTSLRGFTTLLLARYFAENLIHEGAAHEEDALALFLRFEQIAGYAREVVHEAGGGIRGIERVRRNLSERRGRVLIGDGQDAAILGDQKTYGLWGLFTVSARVSGLVPAGPVGVTKAAREFVEAEYAPLLRSVGERLSTLLLKGGEWHAQRNDRLCAAVAQVLKPSLTAAERQFYAHYLRDAQSVEPEQKGTADAQQRVSGLLAARSDLLADNFDRTSLRELKKAATSQGDNVLADRLQRIDEVESLIAPAEHAFLFLLTQHGQTRERVAEKLRTEWGHAPRLSTEAWGRIKPHLASAGDNEQIALIARVHDGLMLSKYEATVDALVDWNALVMKRRNGYPWVGWGPRSTLDVRYRAEEEYLPAGEALDLLWRNTYFLESLRSITAQLEDGS